MGLTKIAMALWMKVFGGAMICDGRDNDCDGQIDEGDQR